ncbi:glycosyltransferase family 2 protein [uncultured Desulfobacter sp.]|uniref:glycosyltransferase family 2 protein n=1 Tax=uncultured Desulfobacter sp. TaxID=240139 RepID=UPI0029C62ACC|nr:glycosyltransferase family 2 protein [uncultured Desulfobacter sp.]
MDLSFVILTWNSEKYIEKCLSSIVVSLESSPLNYEVLIVDNGSQDNTIKIITEQKGTKIRLIELGRNTGTTYPRNLSVKKAKGEYICIMDSDVEIFPGTIEILLSDLKKDISVGLVVPKLIYPGGNLQKSTDQFPTVFQKAYRYFFLKKIEAKENKEKSFESPIFVDYAISALWVIKRSIFIKVGMLDEKIFYSPEDVDFCLRLWKAGYKILYNPRAVAIHYTQEISRGFKLNKAFFDHLLGLLYYFLKHRYLFVLPSFKTKQNTGRAK